MNQATVRRLNAINEHFYQQHAAAFDSARQAPWSGWERVLVHTDLGRAASILDVGCGNARFGLFATQHFRFAPAYCGLDSSSELLAAARSWGEPEWRLIEGDLVMEDLLPAAPEETFDLVVCFGVMHHIAGEANRRGLLERMAGRVAPGGILAVSFWQFGMDPRFARRVQEWEEFNRSSARPVDLEQLEPGDHLLYWGEIPQGFSTESPAKSRYCHYADPGEVERLVDGLPLSQVDAFTADGKSGDLNLYRILTRSAD
jgi:SAM-dependent methyltransferase